MKQSATRDHEARLHWVKQKSWNYPVSLQIPMSKAMRPNRMKGPMSPHEFAAMPLPATQMMVWLFRDQAGRQRFLELTGGNNMRYMDFTSVISVLGDALRKAPLVHTEDWQGTDVRNNPAASTRELINMFFTVPMKDASISQLQEKLNPHLPWADEHFAERVGGVPVNPPSSYKNWRHAENSAKFLVDGKFDASYPERFWPKEARGRLSQIYGLQGWEYGDLNDLVQLLKDRPLTRRGYMPLFHPEETGVQDRRTMCSTGFWVVNRGDQLHMTYHIRSCDFVNHFCDDLYLFARLLLWICEQTHTRPGDFNCWVGSLHIFINDSIKLWGHT